MSAVGDALALYRRFHDKEPDWVGGLPRDVEFPRSLGRVGQAKWVGYRSAKWSRTGKRANYLHEFETDVIACELWRPGLDRVRPPRWPREIVDLGDCLGLAVERDGSLLSPALRRGTKLVASPDGRVLALCDPAIGIVAVLVGGGLRVTERGIEG